jgi:radical SAM superfamily enzyme YgiQ (UPF0313 family)
LPPRLALVNPWITDFAAANLWSSPLGLWQVAEFLSSYTREFFWLDCLDAYRPGIYGTGRYLKTQVPKPAAIAEVPRRFSRYGIATDQFRERLQRALPLDAVLVTSLMTYWYPGVQEAIRMCKEIAPQTPVILGGIYARLLPGHAARHSGADVVYSEPVGEKLLEVLAALGLKLEKRFPPSRYYALGLAEGLAYAPLLTSAGCPYACTYCASPLLNPQYTQRAPGDVLAEMRALQARGVTDLAFYDDALLVRADTHLEPLLETYLRAPLPLRFHTPNGLHAACVSPRTASLMRAAGFKTLRLSLETVDARHQAETGGKVTVAAFERAVESFKQAGYAGSDIGVYLMYGLAGQAWPEVEAGVAYLRRLQVRIQLAEYSPIPGTPMWRAWEEDGRMPADLDPLWANNTVFAWKYAGYAPEAVAALKLEVKAHNRRLKEKSL